MRGAARPGKDLPHTSPRHVIRASKIAMNLPDTLTFLGGSATIVEARNLDLFGWAQDGVRYVDQRVARQTPEGDLVVNVVGLPDAESVSGWVLMLG